MRTIISGCGGITAVILLMIAMHHMGWISIDPMVPLRDFGGVFRHIIHA